MGRIRKDFIITAGDQREITFPIKTTDPCAVKDLTGYTGNFVVTTVGGTTPVLTVAMTLVSATDGTIKVTLTSTHTGTTLSSNTRYEAHIRLNDGSNDNTVEDLIYLFIRPKKV